MAGTSTTVSSRSFGKLLIKRTVFFVAGEIRSHDVRARLGVLVLLNEVGESFIHERLKLTAFRLGECSHGCEDLWINLSGEFLASLGYENAPS